MVDLKKLYADPSLLYTVLHARGIQNGEDIVREFKQLHNEYNQTKKKWEDKQHQIKKILRKVADVFIKGGGGLSDTQIKLNLKKLKIEGIVLKKKKDLLKQKYKTFCFTIPNILDDLILEEKLKEDKIIGGWKEKDNPPIKGRPHWELSLFKEGVDFSAGSKITGRGFAMYKGKVAKLIKALSRFFLDQAEQAGYEELIPPLLVSSQSALHTGQLPDKEGMMFVTQKDNFFLIPTAEVPITNFLADKILLQKDFPKKYVAYTACFRREAGSWGKDVRGLNRLRQFDKVEIVEFHADELIYPHLERMTFYVENLIKQLSLIYRVVRLCSKNIGFATSITHDIEVWSPGQGKWLEVSSVSSFKDFQTRRMKLRYKKNKGKAFPYSFNGSALAFPRIIAALLEQYSQKDEMIIPKVLKKYLN